MITNCKNHINGEDGVKLWDQDLPTLVQRLEVCDKLWEAYKLHYRSTKDKLLTMPKGKQFDFDETVPRACPASASLRPARSRAPPSRVACHSSRAHPLPFVGHRRRR